ncbi:hypothetical protein [Microbacterium sp.]|uniref:hypothetical protein n=1 Tax=Microbacterium sp. TaxID=51671 RepID=UPI003C788208
MNTATAPQRSVDQAAPPDPLQLLPLQGRTPRTTLLDRIAMRIALQLLLWSSRPAPDAERAYLQHKNRIEREHREAAWLLTAHRIPRV